jgi:hypothetical protein
MNCYEHQNVVAVAACSQGCGRALCGQCAAGDDLPRCKQCAPVEHPQANDQRHKEPLLLRKGK